MHHRLSLWLALLVFAFVRVSGAESAAVAQSAMPPGQIVAKQVVGKVSVQLNGTTTDLKNDDAVSQASTIITARESSVVLVLSNGATVQLGAETTMVIEEFLQNPFAATISMANMVEEPTTSKTKLRLMKGELVGKVAHLKRDQGSEFTVQTPVGAAGIRGTTFRIVFRPTGTGQAFAVFSLSTVEGQVLFQQGSPQQAAAGSQGAIQQGPGQQTPGQPGDSQAGAGSPGQGASQSVGPGAVAPGGGGGLGGGVGAGLPVGSGQEVVVTLSVNVNQQTGQVTLTAPPSVVSAQPINIETQRQIVSAAELIATATSSASFTAPPPPTPPPAPQQSGPQQEVQPEQQQPSGASNSSSNTSSSSSGGGGGSSAQGNGNSTPQSPTAPTPSTPPPSSPPQVPTLIPSQPMTTPIPPVTQPLPALTPGAGRPSS